MPDVAFAYCQLDADYGLNCKSQNETAWFYNRTSGACETFVFGGCLGNQNRFLSRSICHSVCVLRSVVPPFVPPSRPPTTRHHTPSRPATRHHTPQVPVTAVQNAHSESTTTPPAVSRPPLRSSSPTQTVTCEEVDCSDKDCSVGGFDTDEFGCRVCICADPCEVCAALSRRHYPVLFSKL